MPYIVHSYIPAGIGRPETRHAVATLEEARDLAATEVEGSPAWIGTEYAWNDCPRLTADAENLPAEGGTVGPLPDGYVIDVLRVSDNDLRTELVYVRDIATRYMSEAEVIAAYNTR